MQPIVRPYNPQGGQPPLITYQDNGNGQLVPVVSNMGEMLPQPTPQAGAMPLPAASGMPAPMPMPGMQPSGTMPGAVPPGPQSAMPSGSIAPNPLPQARSNPFASSSTPDLDAAMKAGPPKTPEEAASRKNAWTQFAQTVQQNPQMQMLLMRLGSNLVQPVAPGQTPIGHLGMAVQDTMNYKAALDTAQQQSRKMDAEIAQTQAQTGTEIEKPAAVRAGVAQTQAQTAQTEEETTGLRATRGLLVTKLQQEIDNLKTTGEIDDAKAKIFRAQADKEPQKLLEEIELMKAHAWYYRNPGASARATEAARVQSIDNLAQAYVTGGNDELTKLYKTDPQTALSKAKVLAAAGQTAGFWNNQAEDGQADEIFQMYSDMYETLNKTGSKQVKGQTKEEFVIQQLMLSNTPPSINSKVMARLGRTQKGGAPAKPGVRPPLSTFDK